MIASICLLSCVLAAAQPVDKAQWHLSPQLAPGLELVYTGSYAEESLVPNASHQTVYRLEVNALVLDAGVKDWQVALLTGLSRQPASKKDRPTSLHLELVRVDAQGKPRGADKKPLEIPLKDVPIIEFGFFAPAPTGKVGRNFTWDSAEPGRPPQTWRVLGTESCGGVSCIKIEGVQQSADWEQVRADMIGWRRRDTLWVHPQLFVAQKVERIIEHRAAAHNTPTARTVVKYELETQLRYPGRLFEERRTSAIKAAKFQQDAQDLLRQPILNRQLTDALIHRISYHLEHAQSPDTPYHQCDLYVRQELERAKKGEIGVRPAPDEFPALALKRIEVGRRAPEFAASSLTEEGTHRLAEFAGKPALIFFYNPATPLGREVLVYMKRLSERKGDQAAIIALAATNDADGVRQQHKELHLNFPILDGAALRLSYGATETPRFVVIDGEGMVIFAETGWGYHTPVVIEAALERGRKK